MLSDQPGQKMSSRSGAKRNWHLHAGNHKPEHNTMYIKHKERETESVCVCDRERERDRQTDRQRETKREKQTDTEKQTDRQTGTHSEEMRVFPKAKEAVARRPRLVNSNRGLTSIVVFRSTTGDSPTGSPL